MRERFHRFCRAISCRGDEIESADMDRLFDELAALMSESYRAYHNMEHVAACLAQLGTVARAVGDAVVIEGAIWYHDAIYDPQRNDNESQSARLACDHLASIDVHGDALQTIERLILATRHSGSVDQGDPEFMVDIDLSILGQPDDKYDRYESAIACEYAWVARERYVAGRMNVLQSFLDRPSIYLTRLFRERYERQARSNLSRVIDSLAHSRVDCEND